jgi:AcrR family transcriptional regulator
MTTPSLTAMRPPTERGRKTRHALLEAAETVFGARGYEEASISEITQRAGVAQGTFYVYFEDKKAIYIELVDELGSRLRRFLAAATDGIEDRLEVERAGLAAFFRFIRTHGALYRLVRQAEFVDKPAFRRYYDRLAEGYAAGLAKAMDAKQVRRANPEIVAYCLMGMADFLGMRWVLWEKDDAALERVVETAAALIRDGLAPREAKVKRRRGAA